MTYVRELQDKSGGRLGVIEVSMRMTDVFPEIYHSDDSSWACFVDERKNCMTAERQQQPASGRSTVA